MSKVVLQHCKFKCDVWLASGRFISEQKNTANKKDSSYIPVSSRNIGPSPGGCALSYNLPRNPFLHFGIVVLCNTEYFSNKVLTLRLLMSYIYGAPSKARNANVVYIWTYVWQR